LTTDYITVQATNGTKIVRARKNVILQTRWGITNGLDNSTTSFWEYQYLRN
jgi:hypothetical protein